MLTNNSKALLERMEAKYITMLEMVRDIATISMGDTQAKADLEKIVRDQQQAIHEAASRLKCCQ